MSAGGHVKIAQPFTAGYKHDEITSARFNGRQNSVVRTADCGQNRADRNPQLKLWAIIEFRYAEKAK